MPLFTFFTNPPKCKCDQTVFTLHEPTIDLYDGTAKQLAEELAKPEVLVERGRGQDRRWEVVREAGANKPAQVRKIYDELCMWEQKAKDLEAFKTLLPFIKMMNAKVAYARGRELVDDKLVTWFSICMGQIREANEMGLLTLKNFRTLFEAFLGFYKQARPS
jgi:CRISPR-associated protein Csm2